MSGLSRLVSATTSTGYMYYIVIGIIAGLYVPYDLSYMAPYIVDPSKDMFSMQRNAIVYEVQKFDVMLVFLIVFASLIISSALVAIDFVKSKLMAVTVGLSSVLAVKLCLDWLLLTKFP